MPRYIDAELLKTFLHEDDFGTPDERWKPESEFAQMIDACPAADVVEVVRCKDCIHWETVKTLYGEDNVCKAQGCMTVAKKPDDYCSLGEREEKSAPVTAESAIREIQEAAKEYAEQLKKIGKDEDVLFRLQLGRTMDL